MRGSGVVETSWNVVSDNLEKTPASRSTHLIPKL